ncbi:DNA transfer protein [Yokenella regensburgei]|uniref:DNA transfer protein n=1 Tax=Yokenella regensburgei TaxID=158877 RepID=UPI003F16A30D
MSGIAKGVGSIVGSITGANQAASAQKSAANQSNATALQIYNDQKKTLAPFLGAGQAALTGLQGLAGQPIDRNASLLSYLSSPEYQMLSNQARYQGLNAAEATGGLGSTATGNMLSSIAPQLGQNYLSMMTDQQNNMYQQLLGLTNVGLSSGGATNAAAGNYSNSVQNNLAQVGAANAGASLANGNALTSGLGYLAGTSTAKTLGNSLGSFLTGLF